MRSEEGILFLLSCVLAFLKVFPEIDGVRVSIGGFGWPVVLHVSWVLYMKPIFLNMMTDRC